MGSNEEKNIHAGHRRRMLERFRWKGFDGWQQHEIVEALLFIVLPRINTNILGHKLINAFGGLKNLLEAKANEIVKTKGIGDTSASFIAGIRDDISERIKAQFYGENNINIYQIAYLADWFMRDSAKPIGMMIFDQDDNFVDFVCLPVYREDGVINAQAMFEDIEYDLTNLTFRLCVKPENELTEEDINAIRLYTFAQSFILDEIYVMNRKQPVPTLYPYNKIY